jgi:elongation factor Ts
MNRISNSKGRVAIYIDHQRQVGAIIELHCENAFVAKREVFAQLANDLAKQIALANPDSVDELLAQPFVDDTSRTIRERIGDVSVAPGEEIQLARFARRTGLLGEYVHHDGSVGVLVQVEGVAGQTQMLRDVSMHITAKNPLAASREHIDPSIVERERAFARSQATAICKTAPLIERMAERKLDEFFAENVLTEQPFVKDSSKTVGDLLRSAGLKLDGFVRYRVDTIR